MAPCGKGHRDIDFQGPARRQAGLDGVAEDRGVGAENFGGGPADDLLEPFLEQIGQRLRGGEQACRTVALQSQEAARGNHDKAARRNPQRPRELGLRRSCRHSEADLLRSGFLSYWS